MSERLRIFKISNNILQSRNTHDVAVSDGKLSFARLAPASPTMPAPDPTRVGLYVDLSNLGEKFLNSRPLAHFWESLAVSPPNMPSPFTPKPQFDKATTPSESEKVDENLKVVGIVIASTRLKKVKFYRLNWKHKKGGYRLLSHITKMQQKALRLISRKLRLKPKIKLVVKKIKIAKQRKTTKNRSPTHQRKQKDEKGSGDADPSSAPRRENAPPLRCPAERAVRGSFLPP